MRILYMNLAASSAFNVHFQEVLDGCAGPDVEVIVRHLDIPEYGASPFLPPEPAYMGVLFRDLLAAQEDGFDGVVLGCSDDPALIEARRMLEIPVTGPLESALHLGSQLGQRVCVLVPEHFGVQILFEDQVRYYGLNHLVSEFVQVPIPYPEPEKIEQLMRDDPEELAKILLECHRTVLSTDALNLARGAVKRGAGVVYAGCTLWSGTLQPLRAALGVPVIDPAQGAVVMAAAAARARLG